MEQTAGEPFSVSIAWSKTDCRLSGDKFRIEFLNFVMAMLVENVLLPLNPDPQRSAIRPEHAVEPMVSIVDPNHVVRANFGAVAVNTGTGMTGIRSFEVRCIGKVIVDVFHFAPVWS